MAHHPDIIELSVTSEAGAAGVFGLLCEYMVSPRHRLSERANDALEWIVENRRGTVDIGSVSKDGFVSVVFYDLRDAALFKTFWL